MRKNRATLPPIPGDPSVTPVTAVTALIGQWEDNIEGQQAYRTICGADRHITDHEATVYQMVVQLADGSIQDDEVSSPGIYVCQGDRDCLPRLNVDQARELAAALLDCVAELDGWVNR